MLLNNSVRRAVCVFSLALLGAGSAWGGETLDAIRNTGRMTLGYRENAIPFSWKTESGQVVGYAIEICQRLAAAVQEHLKLHRLEVRYVPVTSADRVRSILDKRIDLECGVTTNTPARRELVALGLAYFYAGARLLVREGEGILSLQDMKNKTLGLVKGTTGELVMQKHQRQHTDSWKTQLFDSTNDGVTALEQGRIDGILTDDVQLLVRARQSSRHLELVGPALSIEPLTLAFSKADRELGSLVDGEMKRLYRSGAMQEMYQRWFRSPLPELGYSLDLAPGRLLNDNFQRPSAYVADWVML